MIDSDLSVSAPEVRNILHTQASVAIQMQGLIAHDVHRSICRTPFDYYAEQVPLCGRGFHFDDVVVQHVDSPTLCRPPELGPMRKKDDERPAATAECGLYLERGKGMSDSRRSRIHHPAASSQSSCRTVRHDRA